jgi:hypothetical protein
VAAIELFAIKWGQMLVDPPRRAACSFEDLQTLKEHVRWKDLRRSTRLTAGMQKK